LPIATFESDISHAAESVMTRSRARPHVAESRPVDAPGALADQAPTTRIMPAPPAQPGPLPPPASDAFDWSEIAPHVERLVRDTIAHERRPAPARPGEAGAAPAPAALPRPATAASASVIGALERPPRHTMLFGTRLR
jgi:hypothetical protein